MREEHNEQAERYLHDNLELRAALGIDESAALVPHPLGEGEHNLNYRFCDPSDGRTFVLRINVASQPFHDDQVAYEFSALKTLAPSGCTPQPLYLDNTSSAPQKGVLVIGFCEGDMLDFDALRPGDLLCAAQLMADVHAVSVESDCPLFKPADPLRSLYEECVERYNVYRSSAFEDARITRWVEVFLKAALPAVETRCYADDCAHVINTETLPSHFLIPAHSASAAASVHAASSAGRFCKAPGSFVDWERPIVGEVAQDIAYFTSPTTTFWDSNTLFSAHDAEWFVGEYWRAVDGRFARGNFDERFHAYRMMTALRSVTWCCRALVGYRGGTGHTTEKTAAKLPVYLSDGFMERIAAECFGL